VAQAEQRFQLVTAMVAKSDGLLGQQRFRQSAGELYEFFTRSVEYLKTELTRLIYYIRLARQTIDERIEDERRLGRLQFPEEAREDDVEVAEYEEEGEEDTPPDAKRRKQAEARIRARFPNLLAAAPCAKSIALCAHHIGIPVERLTSPVTGYVSDIDYVDGVVTILPDNPALVPHHVKILFDEWVIPLTVGQNVLRDGTTLAIMA
jgi:hypothetical protein